MADNSVDKIQQKIETDLINEALDQEKYLMQDKMVDNIIDKALNRVI